MLGVDVKRLDSETGPGQCGDEALRRRKVLEALKPRRWRWKSVDRLEVPVPAASRLPSAP